MAPRSVEPFDLTIVWPVVLSCCPPEKMRERLQKTLPADHWQPEKDLLRRGQDGYGNAEWTYSHPFARPLLYGDPGTPAPYDLYLRKGFPKLAVEDLGWSMRFDVRQIRLYAMDNSSAILTVDLAAEGSVSWDTMQNAVSLVRTVSYQHFTPSKDDGWEGGGGLDGARWEPLLPEREPARSAEMLARALSNREVPLLRNWQLLLEAVSHHAGIQLELSGDVAIFVLTVGIALGYARLVI